MTATTRVSLPFETWTALSSGDANVLVQAIGPSSIEVAVAGSTPGSTNIGHTIGGDGDKSISLNSLTGSDNVYARAIGHANIVAVTK